MISCKVMEDILPLYVDECCSEDTKKLIEEHLLECEHCKEKLEKLRQPMFLSQEQAQINQKTYVKRAKRAFGKIQRRLVAVILMISIVVVPLTWLGVNEVKGEGVSYSSLTHVIRGNLLLRALKNGNYEKAFSYLNLKPLYEWETEFEERNMDLEYKPVNIGGNTFYVDEETYRNNYQWYLADEDEAVFWKSIYLSEDYMIPVFKVEKYLSADDEVKEKDFMEYKFDGSSYYINANHYCNDVGNVGNSTFKIMSEEYYDWIKKQIKEEEKEDKEFIQKLIDKGYDEYVAEYKEHWIHNFKELEEEGVSIEGYKLTLVDHFDNKYQLDYQIKLNVNGKMNYDYGVTFNGKENGFYPNGGSVNASSLDNIPIIGAFDGTLE